MNLVLATVYYVISDPWFWPSMSFTVMTGIYIGAVLFDGDRTLIKKAVIALLSLIILIISTNIPRIMANNTVGDPGYFRPYASIATTVVVSLFYLFGMWFGVRLVSKAHKGRET